VVVGAGGAGGGAGGAGGPGGAGAAVVVGGDGGGTGDAGQSPLPVQALLGSVLQRPTEPPDGYVPQLLASPHALQQQFPASAEAAKLSKHTNFIATTVSQ